MFLVGILNSLGSGVNDTMYRLYKEIFNKYFTDLDGATQTKLSRQLPASITNKDDATQAINAIRNEITGMIYGTDKYNSASFYHSAVPQELVLYIRDSYANKLTDYIKLDHYTGEEIPYSNSAFGLSQFLGIPVRLLDDFGGLAPWATITATKTYLVPIFDAEGSITGTYAAPGAPTVPVAVEGWDENVAQPVKAVLAEQDFGNVFIQNDKIGSIVNPRGGGYQNTFRFRESLLVAKPQSNTIYFR